MMYYSGDGTQQDFKLAAQYLQESADNGDEMAQKYLGYENGKMPEYGMPLEEVLKRHWDANK